jgi:hypothetical protein
MAYLEWVDYAPGLKSAEPAAEAVEKPAKKPKAEKAPKAEGKEKPKKKAAPKKAQEEKGE